MTIDTKKTRFISSMTGIVLLATLAIIDLLKGGSVVAPFCVTGIMTIVGGLQYSQAHTKGKLIDKNLSSEKP